MATLPRTIKAAPGSALALFTADAPPRPHSHAPGFDAGLNSSAAWTEHMERFSLSDDEPDDTDDTDDQEGRSARALYFFEGRIEFRELIVEAGDALDILKEDAGDGWSLARTKEGQIGLLPRTYYTFTTDFLAAPKGKRHGKEVSTGSITPKASPKKESTPLPLVPQITGEWIPNLIPTFRQSLLRGRSINRFSPFVTSGAEDWVLHGVDEPLDINPPIGMGHSHMRSTTSASITDSNRLSRLVTGGIDTHFIDAGPSWQSQVPEFGVLVHSPQTHKTPGSGGSTYTTYSVTSVFHPPSEPELNGEGDGENGVASDGLPKATTPNGSLPPTTVTVQRRFSHFVVLHTVLLRRLPSIALPPLPDKQYAGRFSAGFVEARRGDLERYINRVVKHPLARHTEVLTAFLGCESDDDWDELMPRYLSTLPSGSSFFARVFHPAFNIDVDEASETVDRFESHIKNVGRGVQGLRNMFGRYRESRQVISQSERLLSYSMLSMITSKSLSSTPPMGISDEEDTHSIHSVNSKGKPNGMLNEEGAWCWREGCTECLKLTKALQKTSETLQSVAGLYDDHAERTQLATHEALKSAAHPYPSFEGIIDTHRTTVSRHKESMREGKVNEDMAARCETVLNTTMAEMEAYHRQKVDDFANIAKDHLDGEIAFYEQVLARLRTARSQFDSPAYDELGKSARQPSRYERELDHPRVESRPLTQPYPHVYDSAPMRPVSVAIGKLW